MSDLNPIVYFLSGGFGGICTVLVGHPLDTVKVRLQTMPQPKAGEAPLYSGTLDCITKTIKNEGPQGLYKGMGAPLASVAPIFAISFMGYGIGKKIFGPPPGQPFTPLQYYAAGAFSGFLTAFIMSPGERIKCLLQIQSKGAQKLYDGPIDCAVKLYKHGGIANIYKGIGATLLRDGPGTGFYFLTYEMVQKIATDNGKRESNLLGTICAGGLAGTVLWLSTMPADVLKSRIQTAPEGSNVTMVSAFKELMQKEGPLALYKGITPILLRSFPANAACLVGFETAKKFLSGLIS